MLDAQERVQVALNLNLREEVLIEKARPQAAAGCRATREAFTDAPCPACLFGLC
jgi:hypothetical protein